MGAGGETQRRRREREVKGERSGRRCRYRHKGKERVRREAKEEGERGWEGEEAGGGRRKGRQN